ncbi:MAG: serine hydrolase [Burkholderiaceae bacterium]|nr:serine hydrolase [Burkholderiaceae bacterium]
MAALALSTLASAARVDASDANALPDMASLFSWTQAERVAGFSHSADLVPTEPFTHASTPSPLPAARPALVAKAQQLSYQYGTNADGSLRRHNSVDDYMAHNKVTGLLVLKDGAVVMERYAMGIDEHSLWDSKSVGKSVVSTLFGVALHEGAIHSLDDPIDRYVPELAGSAYHGVALRHLLQMASGVAWREDYADPKSDIAALLACTKKPEASCILDLMKGLPRVTDSKTGAPVKPGERWNYSSGEAWLTGLVVQRATGRSLSKYLEAKIWQKMGMEADGLWMTDKNGVSIGAGAFNATLRDYGRMGQFVLAKGVLPNGEKLLPDRWMSDATRWTRASAVPDTDNKGIYGYMWWRSASADDGRNHPSPKVVRLPGLARPVSDSTFMAEGVYGQMIAINPPEKLVVVEWSVWDKPDPTCCDEKDPEYVANNPWNEQATFVNALIQALH